MALELRVRRQPGKIRLNIDFRRLVQLFGPHLRDTAMRILTIALIAALIGTAVGGTVGYVEVAYDPDSIAGTPGEKAPTPEPKGKAPRA